MWKVMVLVAGFMAQPFLLAEASDESQTLYARMAGAWQTVNTKYYHTGTSQYYTAEPSLLPTAQQVQNLDPDDCGYGTGMDDVPLFGGTLLVSLCDQYDVTQDVSLKAEADKVFAGLELCVTGHGVPGFVSRGICPEDGESIYICSSRDQYTNLVHGMWRYYHSPLCDEESQSLIQDIFRAIADRMIQNVTPQNNYDFLRADNSRDLRGICRMWNVNCHEAARLPMIYAAAWDVLQEQEYYDQYRQYLPAAIQQSLELPNLTEAQAAGLVPPYAVLQMQNSLEVLYDLETDPTMKSQVGQAMLQVAEFAETKLYPTARQSGELALARLMCEDFAFSQDNKNQLTNAIMNANYSTDPEAAYCLLGGYWKAVKTGVIQEANTNVIPQGDLLVEENFDYDLASWDLVVGSNNNLIVTGLDGGTGFAADSQWGVGLQSTTTGIEGKVEIVDGLTFSDLATSGNALFTRNTDNSALASRAIGVTVDPGSTVWTSYLWKYTATALGQFSCAYSQLTDAQFGTTNRRMRILPNQYNADSTSSMSDGSTMLNATIPTLEDGDTYLVIGKNTNIGQSGTGTLWIIAESDFDICAADGSITEQELYDNCVGTVTGDLGMNTITYGAFLQLAHVWGAGTFDEFRMGMTLEAVTPLMVDIPGDANRDGKVDGSDVTILAGNWQAGVGDPNTETITWEMGDFNGDGQIDGSDVTILAGNWQYGVEATASAVPEPGAITLLLYGLVALFFARRR